MIWVEFVHWLLAQNIWLAQLVVMAGLMVVMAACGALCHGLFILGGKVTAWWDRRQAEARLRSMLQGMSAAEVHANRREIIALMDRTYGR